MLRSIILLGAGLGILLVSIFANIAAINTKYESSGLPNYNRMLFEPALLNERGKRYRRYTLYALLFLPFWVLAGKVLIRMIEGTWAP